MKKKYVGFLVAAALIMSQAMGVCASPVTEIGTEGSSSADYVASSMGNMNESGVIASDSIPEETKEEYRRLAETEPERVENIRQFNQNQMSIEEFISREAPQFSERAEGKRAITPVFDVSPINGGRPDENGHHHVELSLPSLSRAMTNLVALHFDMAGRTWEEIEITNVDYDNKRLTLNFGDSLSPVIILADVAEGASVGTSPKTGNASVWGLWMTAAAVLGAASAGSLKKAKNTRR